RPRHVLSEECTLQLDKHLGGTRVDRRCRLLHTSTRTLDPSGQCSELLARLGGRDVLLEPIIHFTRAPEGAAPHVTAPPSRAQDEYARVRGGSRVLSAYWSRTSSGSSAATMCFSLRSRSVLRSSAASRAARSISMAQYGPITTTAGPTSGPSTPAAIRR